MEDTIVNEKNKYNKAYTELMFCVDDLRKMLDTEELEKRSFISKVDTLKDYIEFLDNNQEFITTYVNVGDKISISKRRCN